MRCTAGERKMNSRSAQNAPLVSARCAAGQHEIRLESLTFINRNSAAGEREMRSRSAHKGPLVSAICESGQHEIRFGSVRLIYRKNTSVFRLPRMNVEWLLVKSVSV